MGTDKKRGRGSERASENITGRQAGFPIRQKAPEQRVAERERKSGRDGERKQRELHLAVMAALAPPPRLPPPSLQDQTLEI